MRIAVNRRKLFSTGLGPSLGRGEFQPWRAASHFLSSHLCNLRGSGEYVVTEAGCGGLRGSMLYLATHVKCRDQWQLVHCSCAKNSIGQRSQRQEPPFSLLWRRGWWDWLWQNVEERISIAAGHGACLWAWSSPAGARKGTAKDVFSCVSGTFDQISNRFLVSLIAWSPS